MRLSRWHVRRGSIRYEGLRWKLKYRKPSECDCDGICYHCNEYGHSDCWQRCSLWRRLWVIFWLDRRKDEIGSA